MSGEPLERGEFKRGRGGRPTQKEAERRHRTLLKTATRLFLKNGWDGTSIDEISRQSGIAKRFIYARYADKAALFIGALQRFIEEHAQTLQLSEQIPTNVDQGLYALGKRLLALALRPDALTFHRLFMAEAHRFPELARLFVEHNRRRGLGDIEQTLRSYADRGDIELGNPQIRAEQFFILVVGVPQRMAMLIGRAPPAEDDRRLRAAVRLFLDGCRRCKQTPAANQRTTSRRWRTP
jgi:TetR/AcrR family transcriptional repressor of mexJK operon